MTNKDIIFVALFGASVALNVVSAFLIYKGLELLKVLGL